MTVASSETTTRWKSDWSCWVTIYQTLVRTLWLFLCDDRFGFFCAYPNLFPSLFPGDTGGASRIGIWPGPGSTCYVWGASFRRLISFNTIVLNFIGLWFFSSANSDREWYSIVCIIYFMGVKLQNILWDGLRNIMIFHTHTYMLHSRLMHSDLLCIIYIKGCRQQVAEARVYVQLVWVVRVRTSSTAIWV
jgi:hypothetical protein